MPQYCATPGCYEKKGGHKFPSNKELCKLWLEAIRRPDYNPPYYARVCKKHFTPDDYEMPRDSFADIPMPKLKQNVVPSRFSWNQKKTPERRVLLRRQCAEIALQRLKKKETVVSKASLYTNIKNASSTPEPTSNLKVYSYDKTTTETTTTTATPKPVSCIKVKVKRYYNFDEVGEDININSLLSVEM